MTRLLTVLLIALVVVAGAGWRAAAQEGVENGTLRERVAGLERRVAALEDRTGELEAAALPLPIVEEIGTTACLSAPGCPSPLVDAPRFKLVCQSAQIWKSPPGQPGPAEQQDLLMTCHRLVPPAQ